MIQRPGELQLGKLKMQGQTGMEQDPPSADQRLKQGANAESPRAT